MAGILSGHRLHAHVTRVSFTDSMTARVGVVHAVKRANKQIFS